MKTLMFTCAAIGFTALAVDAASAASPAYCALYAREYASQMAQQTIGGQPDVVQDQAYYRCLNQDEEPALPVASAYFGMSVGAPLPEFENGTGELSQTGETRIGRSLRTPWTEEWADWCSSHYPNSFDPQTGMIVPSDTRQPEFC